jgi:flagellar biosynthetic protein FliR
MITITNLLTRLFPEISLSDVLLLFSLIFTRWLVMSIMMPFLGAQLLPSLVRLALSALLTIISFILVIDNIDFSYSFSMVEISLLFIKEALIGFILGFLASLFFYAYELFGELVDLTRAASMAKLLVPEVKHHSSLLGNLLFQLALVLYLGLGFHRETIKGAYKSFEIFPVMSLNAQFLSTDLLSLLFNIIGSLFEIAFRFSLPVIVICLVIDMAFGVMNRVAPQINAYFLSLPTKMIGSLVILLLLLPFLLGDFTEHYVHLSGFFNLFLAQK